MSFYNTIFPILFIFATNQVRGEVYVTDEDFDVTIKSFRSIPAKFGQSLPEDGLSGRAVKAHPENGCLYIDPPPSDPHATDAASRRWIAVISRGGGCNFETKVKHATDANWTAAIIYNKKGQNQLVPMAGSDDDVIPSVFIGYDDAQVLLSRYSYEPALQPEFRIVLTDDHPFDINQYLLPFAIVVGICFVIMLVIVIYKCVQDYRRHRRHRLPKSALKKLPIHKFKDGDPFETCVICLDDFQEGDKLRVLPCDHGYHAKCIDPWLVKTKRICPQCRKKVFESNDRGAGLISASDRNSDSDSDAEAPPQSQMTSASNSVNNSVNDNRDESSTAPLLGRPRREYRFFRRGPSGTRTGQRSRRAAGGGTFTSQSSVHAPPRSANLGSDDQQRAGPSGTNRSNLSAVEKLQRAFARESRQQNLERDPRYRHFQNNSSSDNDYQSENLSNDSSDDENTSLFNQQSRNTQESSSASAYPENTVSHGDYNRPSGSKSKNSARNVSAEVHVVPLDDKNVEILEQEESSRVNDSSASGDNSRSQVNELSDNQEKSQLSHIVEIHADEEEVQSSDVDEGNA